MTARPVPALARRSGIVAFALLIASAFGVGPSDAATDPRLAARLDPETAAAVAEVVDSARVRGLPLEPLVARALEGSSRHAPGARIVAAVRDLAGALEIARASLGAPSTQAELVAGAAALGAGVPSDVLGHLREARTKGSLVVPLVVLTDLVTRRVPLDTASAAVVAASKARVRDADLMRLRERINDDIRAGQSPARATVLRTRTLVGTFQEPRVVDPPGTPRTHP